MNTPDTSKDLAGRTAVVTGGASGIGAAVSRRLAAAGASVVVVDRDEAGAKKLAAEIGGREVVADLSDTAAVAALELDCDILVNNAGIQHVSPIEDFPPDRFATILRIMLETPFLLTRAALPGMYERGYGRIINMSSVHGLRASAYKSAYVAAKHGLEGLTKVTALEGGGRGVTAVTVCPGYVRTPLVDAQIDDQARVHGISREQVTTDVFLTKPSVKRMLEPEEVADAVAWLCSPAASYMNGTPLILDGGWSAN